MSQENVEIVRQWMEGVERRDDWEHLDVLAENVLYRPIREITETGEYRGRAQVRRYMERFLNEAWDEIRVATTGYRDLDDKVIARIEFVGRGRASDIELSARVFAVFTIRDGQIVRWEDFVDRAEALEAVGLRE